LPWPAVGVVLIAPFMWLYGVTYALSFGVLPIGVIWTLIAIVWLGGTNGPDPFHPSIAIAGAPRPPATFGLVLTN
jgi:hypothetical protein